jgi:hypothetical protein
MKAKIILPAIAVFLLLFMGGYFLTHPSYDKSLRAKYYYETGDYRQAYSLAKEAFSLDVYNRMASTIMAQSQTSLKYMAYIEDAKKYMKEINKIAAKDTISDADKAKIRLMCEIMISAYIKLAPSVITDDELVKQTAKYHDGFEKLLEKVNR